jgi:amicyanin
MMRNENEGASNRHGVLRRIAWISASLMLMAGGVLKGMPAEHADGKQVVIDNFSFTPATASIPVGTTVTWTNHDDIPHNVVSPERTFKSPVLDTDEVFSHTFTAAGTYKYYCSIHPRMTGQVVVR